MAVPAPASVFHDALPSDDDVIIKFTNCRLADPASLSLPGSSSSSTSPTPNKLVSRDVWVSRATGRILDPQATFFTRRGAPSEVRDCGGRILAPGFLDVQLNGAFGFDFSVPAEHADDYAKGLREVNRQLVRTGVTSYLPTVTSQKPEVYHKVCRLACGGGGRREPWIGGVAGCVCDGGTARTDAAQMPANAD